jgi:hypothetical protein
MSDALFKVDNTKLVVSVDKPTGALRCPEQRIGRP